MPREMTEDEADDHWTEHGDDARPDEMFEDRSSVEASASVGAVAGVVEALRRARRYVADVPIVGDEDLALIDAALARYEASLGALPSASQPSVPTEREVRLVLAARAVAFGDHFSPSAIAELDAASEAYAADVPWENEPEGEQ